MSAITTSIRITSRASLKIRDNFFTVEYCEERALSEDANVDEERKKLWDVCNAEVDEQCEEIREAFNFKK